eukprot:gnl/MRDRNA2_/MRDRNA2_103703_c0_seq1.p1 gnl/MRDRNA2_/MRDRNA2_103703_c0~~gnl/MRDRNA2_/MRDRNA2_103703_c0_seq1.p1  ORF type:complete len:295 (+),score=63.63 gnl/MRDRNA2_/MRDRNA2_103703_c0_seq1:96-980(+)
MASTVPRSTVKSRFQVPGNFSTKVLPQSEQKDLVYSFDCLDFREPPKTAANSGWRLGRDKSAEHDANMKSSCLGALIKNSKPKTQSFSVDADKDRTSSSFEDDDAAGGTSKDGTRTPTESLASERTNGSKGTSPCASPPPELPGSILLPEIAVPRCVTRPACRYSTVEDCVNDKVEFKRILRQLGQNAEFKYRNIRNMFIAADTDNSGKLTLVETVELFANLHLESELAHKFFNFMDKDKSGEIDWREFMAAFGPVFSEKRSTSARDRRCVPQRYNTWRPVPGPVPGMMRMFLA